MSDTITDNIQIFYPVSEYSNAKAQVLISEAKEFITSYCNLSSYPSSNVLSSTSVSLDSVLVKIVREQIRDEKRGGLESRNVEGYAEKFRDGGFSQLSTTDQNILNAQFVFFNGEED